MTTTQIKRLEQALADARGALDAVIGIKAATNDNALCDMAITDLTDICAEVQRRLWTEDAAQLVADEGPELYWNPVLASPPVSRERAGEHIADLRASLHGKGDAA